MKQDKLLALYTKLKKHYEDRNSLYAKVDDHVHSVWELPAELTDVSWMRTVRTTDPSDAIQTTVRTFATHAPKFKVVPMANNLPNKMKANEVESILRWQWKKASQRAEVRPLWDIVESAARYAMVACQVSYLPMQFETYKTMKKDSVRAKAALTNGPYVIATHHPSGIYPQYSDMLLEGVMAVSTQTAEDFCSFWGERAKDLKKKLSDSVQYVSIVDYTDWDQRVVFAYLKTDTSSEPGGDGFEIINEEHDLPFLPWVVKKWGNTLDSSSKHRVTPMLASIIEANQWETQNMLESIGTSLVIQRAASPVAYDETPSGEGLESDFSGPATTVHGTSGLTKYQPLPPTTLDPQIAAYTDRMGARMSKATVARILQNLDFPAGTPYSSVSQILDVAMGSVAPYQELAQDVVAAVGCKMLELASFWKDDLKGYGDSRYNKGQEFTLKYEEYNPADLDISVKLTPYIPIDQVALLNAGILGNKNLKMPLGGILEDIGIEDSTSAMDEWEQERMDETAIQLDIQKQTMALQLEMEKAQTALQMQAQEAQMQQQSQMEQQANAQAQGGTPPSSPGMEQAGGGGFNPAQGGQPPVQMEEGIGRPQGRPQAGTGLK
jgi:hypothetical protein